MNNGELLELAAKAAEIDLVEMSRKFKDDFTEIWNPLADDGDALRLAVKLNIRVQQHPIYLKEKHSAIATSYMDIDNSIVEIATYKSCEGDPYAATRRAIVLAAAEIGKGLR